MENFRKRWQYPDGKKTWDCRVIVQLPCTQTFDRQVLSSSDGCQGSLEQGKKLSLHLNVLDVSRETYVGKFPSPNPPP